MTLRFQGLIRGELTAVYGSILVLCILAGILGCQRTPMTAETLYAQRCESCHGEKGGGNGLAARALPDRPADFSSPIWRSTVNADYVRKVIVRGGTQMGISPLMPSNEDLEEDVELLNDLVQLVLGLSQ